MNIDTSYRVHPKKFTLWLLCLGMVMLFAALTSAYIVRRAEQNWFEFALPNLFVISTFIVLISSVSMIFARRSALKSNTFNTTLGLAITLVLGIAFSVTQVMAWGDMQKAGLYFANHERGDMISASFVYVISALHLLHILGGLIFLSVTLVKSIQLKVNKEKSLIIEMCNTYWHFVGILWVYLYLFLYFARTL